MLNLLKMRKIVLLVQSTPIKTHQINLMFMNLLFRIVNSQWLFISIIGYGPQEVQFAALVYLTKCSYIEMMLPFSGYKLLSQFYASSGLLFYNALVLNLTMGIGLYSMNKFSFLHAPNIFSSQNWKFAQTHPNEIIMIQVCNKVIFLNFKNSSLGRSGWYFTWAPLARCRARWWSAVSPSWMSVAPLATTGSCPQCTPPPAASASHLHLACSCASTSERQACAW